MDKDLTHQKIIYIRIKTPEAILFEGEAEALTSINERGVFDVLPYHTNFISVIREYIIIHQKGKDLPAGRQASNMKKLDIQNGVIRVYENKVQIFLSLEAMNLVKS